MTARKAGRPKGPAHYTRSIRLPAALWRALEAAAEDIGDTTANALVRHAVELWLTLDAIEQGEAKRKAHL